MPLDYLSFSYKLYLVRRGMKKSFPLISEKIDMLTSVMIYHALCMHRDTSHDIGARVQNSPPVMHGDQIPSSQKCKGVNCMGYAWGGGGGVLKQLIWLVH